MALSEDELIEALRAGTQRAKGLIDQLTEYHGGPIKTEYMLTADVARELVNRQLDVRVECLNKKLVNALVASDASTVNKQLGTKRTDIAVVVNSAIPFALIELKIGVGFSKIKDDLKKIVTTISLMKPQFAQKVVGAIVFQIHVGGERGRTSHADFASAIQSRESDMRNSLFLYAKDNPRFSFEWKELQGADEGIVERAVEYTDEGQGEWGEDGHATRYHAIVVKIKSVPTNPPPASLKAESPACPASGAVMQNSDCERHAKRPTKGK